MKPFRRTDTNVPLNCPLPKCRVWGSWGILPHACFSCFVLFASSKENEVLSAKPAEQFRKFLHYAYLFDYLDKRRRNWPALRPRKRCDKFLLGQIVCQYLIVISYHRKAYILYMDSMQAVWNGRRADVPPQIVDKLWKGQFLFIGFLRIRIA